MEGSAASYRVGHQKDHIVCVRESMHPSGNTMMRPRERNIINTNSIFQKKRKKIMKKDKDQKRGEEKRMNIQKRMRTKSFRKYKNKRQDESMVTRGNEKQKSESGS